MSIINSVTEIEDLAKSRKSLLVLSYVLLVFASLSFQSDRLFFLGLEILFSKERAISLLRLSVSIVLTIYILRLLPISVNALLEFLNARHAKWEKKTKDDFPREPHEEEYWHEPEPWEDYFFHGQTKRARIRSAVAFAGDLLQKFSIGIIDHLYPVLLGITTVLYPYSLNVLIHWLGI